MKTVFQVLGFFLLVQSFPALSQTANLSFVGSPDSSITASGITVPLYREARVLLPDDPAKGVPVFLTGSGVLVKQVAFFKVNVYLMTSYTDSPHGIDVENPMISIKESKVKAVQLTLLRSVSAGEIRSEFQLALEANGIDLQSPGIRDLISHINFSMQPRDSVTFIGHSPTSFESLYTYTNKNVAFVTEDKDLALNFWSLWFGRPANAGYADLKRKLVGKF